MNVELDQMEGGTRSMAEKARWGAIRVLRDGILRSSGQENKENCSDPESLAILLKTFILPSLRETSPVSINLLMHPVDRASLTHLAFFFLLLPPSSSSSFTPCACSEGTPGGPVGAPGCTTTCP